MNEQEFVDNQLEKRLQDHYAESYGEVRRPNDLWAKIEPDIRSTSGSSPHQAVRSSAPLPQPRPHRPARQTAWLPLPAGYKPRKSFSWLPRAVAIAAVLALGLLLVWLFSTMRFSDGPIAGTPVAATPTIPIAGEVITTVNPLAWGLGGENTWAYVIGVDDAETRDSAPSAFIKSNTPDPLGAGALQQVLSVEKYHGKRIRFSASLKSEGVEGRAGLWMEINDSFGVLLAGDEMRDRPISGSTGWQPFAVVLDVPNEGSSATYGVQLEGNGQVWISDARVEVVGEVVGQDVPVTG